MNKFSLLLGLCCFTSISCFSQQKFLNKLELGIQLGASIPIGSFSKSVVEPSLDQNFNPENQYREFRGFVKQEGGQAQHGSNLGVTLAYAISPSFYFSINYSRFTNPIDTSPQENYFAANLQNRTDSFGNEFQIFGSLESDNYLANGWYSGFGYRKVIATWSFFGEVYLGVNQLSFPFYTWTFDSPGPTTILRPAPFAESPVPDKLPAFLYGMGLGLEKSISDRIGINLKFKYLVSNHSHEYWTVPLVGSRNFEIEDQINFRVISASVGIALRLAE
ncbi:hypothetical protein [Algoriphagus hitonicola]|uniref:Outer membrane protein beta-barrel domain-containing protein n=1 Tax=Algoriphagus hitonicola TaxID=435880 RepID=A0A1I2PUJ9_9BACT|nr:hypothetical protein [Algoriphagus hitonicola]SFG19945.1 hypothetical protein SAMN04487988_1022 [Algoriphagus hitonicola]